MSNLDMMRLEIAQTILEDGPLTCNEVARRVGTGWGQALTALMHKWFAPAGAGSNGGVRYQLTVTGMAAALQAQEGKVK